MRIIGYGVCGRNESQRYLDATLKEFKRLCDETIILGNNIGKEERDAIRSFGFHLVEDDREWGKNQHIIKEDFVRDHVSKLNPDVTICLDMDETFANVTREKIIRQFAKGDAWYVYIVNLWNLGWREDWSFWNVRMWSWRLKDDLGRGFYKFENRPLHCGLAPKWCYALNLSAPFLLLHSGLMTKTDREAKIARYEKYDPNQTYRSPKYYEALKTNHSKQLRLPSLIRKIESDVSKLKQPLNKKVNMRKEKPKVLILREADGFVFDVEEKLAINYLKQKYKGMGFSILDTAPEVKRETAPLKRSIKTLVYVARHNQKGVDDTEGHISRAFEELGWNVVKVHEGVDEFPEGDVMLYHKYIPPKWDGIKVGWYFDKIYFNNRDDQVEKILEGSDHFFATDGDGIAKLDHPKAKVLRQGVGYDCKGGKEITAPEIVFLGSLYGDRENWYKELKKRYEGQIQHFTGIYGQELNNLCVSAKIFIAPQYPCTDNYWSNRVYDIAGRGGFILHPKCNMDVENVVMYEDDEDLYKKIDYYLKNEEEREKIRTKCRDEVREKFTYKTRVKELCSMLSTKEN